jgi:putative hemolysin
VSDLGRIVAVFALVFANGFFVIAEYALVTSRRGVLNERAAGGSRGAAVALRLMDHPVRFIGTVQVAITALSILLGAVGEPLLRHYFDPLVAAAVSFVLAFAIIAYLSIVIGELVPKAIALQHAETVASAVARPIDLFGRLAWPAVWALQGSANAILKLLGLDDARAGDTVRTQEELRGIVAEAEDAGIIEEAEEEMLYRVFDFADKEAREVMVPLPEVVAIEASLSAEQAVPVAVEAPFTRYPVYRGTIDQIVGIMHIRDLFAAVHGEPGGLTPVAELVRDPVVVPETKDLGPLLRELRATNQHLAVVVDEYGRTVGIVTLKTLLEEIVGEIEDEFQLPDASVQRIDDRTVLVAGTYPVDDFNETFGTGLPTGDFHTIAGLVFHGLGRAGEVGDAIEIAELRFGVQAVDGARIDRLEVRFPAGASGE